MSKISELSDGGAIQSGDTLIAVRSGGNVKVTYGGTTTANIDGGTIDGTVIGGSSAAAGSFTTISASGEIAANGGIALGDNDKATFGASDDLQIYHDGTNSFINDTGTGNLLVRAADSFLLQDTGGKTYLKTVINAQTELSYNNSTKLATTSTGIDVTGTVTADNLTVNKTGGNIAASFINSDSNNSYIQFQNSTTGTTTYTDGSLVGIDSDESLTIWQLESNHIKFGTSATERMRIDSSGNVGIGTSTIGTNDRLIVKTAVDNAVDQGLVIQRSANSDEGYINYNGGAFQFRATDGDPLAFGQVSNERMRIDSSGNLLVGTTSEATWTTTAGFRTRPSGSTTITRSAAPVLYANRLTSDGAIQEFLKDGTTVGSIGTDTGATGTNSLTIDSGSNGRILLDGLVQVLANKYTGTPRLQPSTDNATSLGQGANRWSVVYAATALINTSDEREKTPLEDLDAVELAVAKELKAAIKKFKFKDAVEAKGEAARLHVGVGAQTVKAIFESHGLVAEDYAILCYDEWDAEFDEDGNETRPAGNRYGVRYEELLAFIIAAI